MQDPSLPKAYAMEGGDGPSSYAKNSSFQGEVAELSKKLIRQAIADKLDLESLCLATSSPKKFLIADLGCSTGPNTFVSVQNIIEAIELGHPSLHHDLIFQVFFSDHVSNDFNTLFKTIPPSSRYYAAGVPGSFHGRLFPESSLHIAHSSYSLHWLSKAPEGITNKGRIYWNGAGREVAEAYLAQYRADMGSFLSARAKELVDGGLLMMCFTVRPTGVVLNKIAFIFNIMGSCLVDMAKEGIILEEEVDSFNIPIYHPTVEELEGIIEGNGSFTIEKMVELEHKQTYPITSKMIATMLKAVFGTLIGEHFGYDVIDEAVDRLEKKFEQNALDTLIGEHFRYDVIDEVVDRLEEKFEQNAQDQKNLDYTDVFITLKRNNYVCTKMRYLSYSRKVVGR